MGLSKVWVLEMYKNVAQPQFWGHENHMSTVLEVPLFWERKYGMFTPVLKAKAKRECEKQ